MSRLAMSKSIKVSECKAKFLAVVDEVARTGESVIVTKHGKPVVEVVPHRPNARNAFGIWRDSVKITGDIMSPIDVEWDAMK
jgi:prevent-host-death family protein